MAVNLRALWTSRLKNTLLPFNFFCSLCEVCYLWWEWMLSSQIYIEFTEKCLSVLKFKELFKQPALFFLVSLRQAIWQRWDVVWKGRGQGRHSKDAFQKTLLLCIVHAQGSCLVIIWHIHTFSGDKVTPPLCGWGRCKTDSSTQKDNTVTPLVTHLTLLWQ